MHGVPVSFLEQLNSYIETPDLTVLLDVDYDILRARLVDRQSDSVSENVKVLEAEIQLYRTVEEILDKLGHPFIRVSNRLGQLEQTIEEICSRPELSVENLT